MVELILQKVKDLGLNRQVLDALPTAVVGGAFEGSLWRNMAIGTWWTMLNHVVPAGQQLRLLFLRVFTSDAGGCKFAIVQSNPAMAGITGIVDAFPVVGSVPPYTAGLTTVRDYPFLEAAGAEVLHSSLRDPIHVFEGSIDFMLLGDPIGQAGPSNNTYGIVWEGVEETPEG